MRVFWPVTCESHSSAISGLQMETKNCYVFHFRLLPAKSKTSWKLKILHFGLFLPILGQRQLFQKNPLMSLFLFLDFFCYAEFEKTIMNRFREKLDTDVLTDRRMDDEFIVPSIEKYLEQIFFNNCWHITFEI